VLLGSEPFKPLAIFNQSFFESSTESFSQMAHDKHLKLHLKVIIKLKKSGGQ
jgi:hypothetical protein